MTRVSINDAKLDYLVNAPASQHSMLQTRNETIPNVMQVEPVTNKELPTVKDAETDIAAMIAALGLQKIRRYMDQKHWAKESALARAADVAEPGLKLENVAAHSWQVADATLLLAPHFHDLNASHALELSVLHDKLELITGDFDPVGTDGQGTDSHAFDPVAQAEKINAELAALDRYLLKLRESERDRQRLLILEFIHCSSPEAHFVNAVDKLQALVFVFAIKRGEFTNEHLAFSLKYSAKVIEYFPRLSVHYGVLIDQLMQNVATHRRSSVRKITSVLPPGVRSLAESYIK